MKTISARVIYIRDLVNLRHTLPWLGLLVLLSIPGLAQATDLEANSETVNTFRWIHPGSDPQLWEQILESFSDELTPDEAKQGQDKLDVYQYKYLQRVGILN